MKRKIGLVMMSALAMILYSSMVFCGGFQFGTRSFIKKTIEKGQEEGKIPRTKEEKKQLPAAPSNLYAIAVSSTQINLTWQDNSQNETGFRIERKTGAGGTYSQIATANTNVTSYSDTGLTANTTYYYRVRAYNSNGDSDYSNEVSTTTSPTTNQPNVHIIWQKSFYKELPSIDSYGLTIDTDNNIYASGYSTSTSTNRDFLVTKFNRDGNLLWSVKYDSSPLFDIGMCITSDNTGNFYVTGMTLGNSWDILTLKCDSSSDLLWKKTYDGGNSDGGFGIAVDENDGSVYVSGTSSRGVNGDDIVLLKYASSSGNLLWEKSYNKSVKDHGYTVAVDQSHNVYVCGYVLNTQNTTYDYVVIKYDSNGNLLWEKTYDTGYNDNAIGIAVDTSGNVYVTGQTFNGTNYDFLTIKYDGNGNLLWVRNFDTGKDDLGYAIALDKDNNNNIYLTGQTGQQTNQTTFDFLTIKYDTNGNFLWEKTYDGGTLDGGYAICVDRDGFVYVLGQTQTPESTYNYLLIKYAQY